MTDNFYDYRETVQRDRVNAVSHFGFTERQARFLVNVMVHAGVFVERQYCALAGITHGQKSHDFIAKLLARRWATVIAPGPLHRGRLFHVQYRPLYAAIDEPNNRHRKRVAVGRMIERLMVLDAVLADRQCSWLGTERDKVEYFTLCLHTALPLDDLPHIAFGEGVEQVNRYFPDKLPIGIERDGFRRRHVFLYLATREVPVDFRAFLWRHAWLLRSVPDWTIRLVIPRRFRKAAALYRQAFWDEFARPLDLLPALVIERHLTGRWSGVAGLSPPADRDLARILRRIGAPRRHALQRAWRRHGDRVFLAARSSALREAIDRGYGRLECVELPHQYLHLTSLIGVS